MSKSRVKNLVIISDSHFGCGLAICPVTVTNDQGQVFVPSPIQKKLNAMWQEFWDFKDFLLKKEPWILIHNGDVIDGVHHNSTTQMSQNLNDQRLLAIETLRPFVNAAEGYYQIRGTPAHGGQSCDSEEDIARELGAIQDKSTGRHSRWELWVEFGPELIHFAHHIGTTTSTAYESSAVMRELVAAFVEAGQFGLRPPSIIVRSHRHRYIEVKTPNGRAIVTPSFQAKTPFVYKMDRMRSPMIGGLIIREGKEGVHVREKVFTLERPEAVTI